MDFTKMLAYCKALAANNNRTWFHDHHKEYEEAKKDWYALLDRLRYVIADTAPALTYDILYNQPKDWTYRIARDMRYHKDDLPYNPSFRAYICADKKSWLPLGYFICLAPGHSCFGTGIWFEDTASLNVVRDYFTDHYEEWEGLVTESGLTIGGNMLKKAPRGYPQNHPADFWLRHKDYEIIVPLADDILTCFDDMEETVRELVRRMEPLRQYLLAAARSQKTGQQEARDFYRYR